jgi:tetratricopeptide (TPR) repeat protein
MMRILLTLLISCFYSVSVISQPTLSPRTYSALESIQELISLSKWTEAEEKIETLKKNTLSNKFAQAILLQTQARLWISQNDFDKAIKFYKAAVETESLPSNMQEGAILNLSQLYLQKQKYAKAITLLTQHISNNETTQALTYATLGSAYYLQQDFKLAISSLENATKLDEKKEDWLKMLAYSYYQIADYKSAIIPMHKLITLNPGNRDYWLQQANFYQLQDDIINTMAVLALAQEKGILNKEDEFKHLVRLKINQGMPFKAANMLLKGMNDGYIELNMKNHYLLYQAFSSAREYVRSIIPLQKAAALSEQGLYFMQLAQLYVDLERWGDAVDACALALKKTLTDEQKGKSLLLKGFSAYEGNQREVARLSWTAALNISSSKKEAQRWLGFLESL